MDKLPLITVATVVYNRAKEIENTIKSVLNQSYPHIEYLVIDGGSKDGTVAIIEKYADRITSWVSEPDKGIYYAMNKAIEIAAGEWILFMNSGDFFYSDEVVSTIFTPNSDFSDYAVVYGDAQFRLKKFSYILEALDSALDRFMPFSHQAAFTRTSLAKEYRFDTTYRIAADTEFFLKLTRAGFIFKHLQVVVCSYDASEGLSVHNEVKRSKELVDMQLKHGAKPSDYYRNFIKDARRKQFVRKMLPAWLWNKIREYKLKKQYGIK